LEISSIIHTQEVHGSSPCAPTILLNHLQAAIPGFIETFQVDLGFHFPRV